MISVIYGGIFGAISGFLVVYLNTNYDRLQATGDDNVILGGAAFVVFAVLVLAIKLLLALFSSNPKNIRFVIGFFVALGVGVMAAKL